MNRVERKEERFNTHVVHLMRTYGFHGGERQLAQLFQTAKPKAIEETFVSLYEDKECSTVYRAIPSLGLDVLWPFSIRPRSSPWLELAILLPILPILQARLLVLLLKKNAKICVVHGFQSALVAWPVASLAHSVRFAYVHRITKSSLGGKTVSRLLYCPFSVVAGVSQAVTTSLVGLTREKRLMTLENGIDLRGIEEAGERCSGRKDRMLTVTCVGRLLPHKGQDIVLEAFRMFRSSYPKAKLWIVGDGPYRLVLEKESHRLGLDEHVCFWGRREDVACLLVMTDIFVHASAWEGLSNAVLEAMALGLPSVVADAPGVTECHESGVTGYVVDRRAETLAGKLEDLAGDRQLRQRMGEAARARVRNHYSMEANRQRYLALYQRLADGI